jgi:hypothetical protein
MTRENTKESVIKEFTEIFPLEEVHSKVFSQFILDRYLKLLDSYCIMKSIASRGGW